MLGSQLSLIPPFITFLNYKLDKNISKFTFYKVSWNYDWTTPKLAVKIYISIQKFFAESSFTLYYFAIWSLCLMQ